jgi:hypothetical protein
MVSLVDIGPLTEKVPYRGHDIEVSGISADYVFTLLRDLPEARLAFAGKELSGDVVQTLINSAPRLCASIIAASIGHPGDEKEIDQAQRMSAGETALFMQPIIKMTFPQGLRVFIDGLTATVDAAGGPGWGRDMRLQEQSKSASSTDTPSTESGNTPQGS